MDAYGYCSNVKAETWHAEFVYEEPHPFRMRDLPVPDGFDVADFSEVVQDEKIGWIIGADYNAKARFSDPRSGAISFWGNIKSNRGMLNEHGKYGGNLLYLSFLYGFDEYLLSGRVRFSELLHPQLIKVVDGDLNGIECDILKAKTPNGDFTAWFDRNNLGRLLQFSVFRDRNDTLVTIPVIKARGFHVYDVQIKLHELEYVWSDLEYTNVGGTTYCSGYTYQQSEKYSNGESALVRGKVELSDIRTAPMEPKETGSIDFINFSVPDGTRFHARDDQGTPYVAHNGKIAKVIDEETLESLEGVRFHWTKVSWWPFCFRRRIAVAWDCRCIRMATSRQEVTATGRPC